MEKKKFYYNPTTYEIERRAFYDEVEDKDLPFIELTFEEWEEKLSSLSYGYKKVYLNGEIKEVLDEKVIKIVKEELEKRGEDFRMLVLPDHPTPIAIRTHCSDPVPYLLYDSTDEKDNTFAYSEKGGKESGNYIEQGHTIIDYLFSK